MNLNQSYIFSHQSVFRTCNCVREAALVWLKTVKILSVQVFDQGEFFVAVFFLPFNLVSMVLSFSRVNTTLKNTNFQNVFKLSESNAIIPV